MDNINFYYKPKRAIVFYEKDNDESPYTGRTSPVIKVFNILENNNAFQLGAGRAISNEDLNNIARKFNNVKEIRPLETRDLIPANLLYFSGHVNSYKIVWYILPGGHHMMFGDKITLKDGVYALPGLVFCAARADLQVYAYKGNKPLTAETPLFIPPTFNTHQDGGICLGNIKIKTTKEYVEDNIKEWEKGFFGSKFTHPSIKNLVKKINVYDLYKQMFNKKEGFPDKVLIPMKKKVEDLL